MGHRSWKAALAVWVVVGCGGDVDSPPDANVDGSSEVVLDPCDSNRDCSGGEICREGSCRVACEDATECSAPLALCDDARGYCVACIDDDDCATHATCEASFCTFFCRDDSACAADERCIVDSGVCTERECESARECEGGFRCEGFVCVPIDDLVCEAGEEACSEDATTALRCNDDGTMEARTTCDEDARCVVIDEAAVCREVVCTADERGCTDGDTTFACDGTGTERTETDCAAGQSCEAGDCLTRACTPGVARCDASGAREVCDEAGTGYVASPCAATDVCVDGVCLERLCERGSARCVEGSPTAREVCGADERSWASMPCSDGETCAAGSCETRVCTPALAECVGSGGSRECLPTGLGFTATVSCPTGQSCTPDTGRCGAWICTPASTSCESLSTLRTCNADGLGHSTSPCAATESCSAGACRPRICAPGTFSCADVDTRRLCAADGLGYTSAPCTGSDPDGYSCTGAGTCVARACVPGSVDATCASLTDRRVCNADGSGYLVVGCADGQSCDVGVCAVRCGDGIVGGSEACDDGNLRDGDTCSSTCTTPSYADLVRAHGALAYWPLDELVDGVTPDVLGTWPATAYGVVTSTTGLRTGSPGAMRTNGSDAYLEPMADTSAFQSVPFSVELWFRRESSERFDLVVSTRGVGAAGWDLFFHDGTSQRLVFELGDGAWHGTPGVSIAVGAVVHLVATFDGTTARLYVDGSEVASAAAGLSPSTVPFRIGAGASTEGNPSGYTHATFDDVAIYDRVLTPSEIGQHAATR
ncbi:MAG: LamG-like jellyroll fold domain-containing protein [Polyangiales bacterium]